jgi:glycolate oxidase iron-sulfur subunit
MNTKADPTSPNERVARIQKLTHECVMCGICVPHCPTFALTGNEADGPRGRISLSLGLSESRLGATPDVIAHLDTCLTCRACESVCPSLVQYGAIIDETRAALVNQDFAHSVKTKAPKAADLRWRWLRDRILSQRQAFGRAWSLLRFLDKIRFLGLMRRFGGRLAQTLPPARPARFQFRAQPAPITTQTQKVGLFIGCTGESLSSDVVRASIHVLNTLGYAVQIPKAQVCCGAMHQHGGDLRQAAKLRAENQRIFADSTLTAIIVIGTACTGELQRESWGVPVVEITDFLANISDALWPMLAPNPATVAIHLPCSQTRVLKNEASTERLLRKIPTLTLLPLSSNDRCCGAAGLHVLMYPAQADALRTPKLLELAALKPDFVVSANIGCATHLAAGLGQPVLHPVELVARSCVSSAVVNPAPQSHK